MLTEDELISRFVALMGCDETIARQYLIREKWRFWGAVGAMEHDINIGLLFPFDKGSLHHSAAEKDQRSVSQTRNEKIITCH